MKRKFTKRNITIPGIAVIALLVLLALTSLPRPGRAEITVSATLSAVSFSVDEGAMLTITVNGTRSAELEIPEVKSGAFEIIQRGRSSQVNMINGDFSSSITFNCLVNVTTPGSYTIPPITIHADGDTRTTAEIPFTATAAPQQGGSGTAVAPPPASGKAGGQMVFLRLVGGKAKSYLGEVTPVEVKAYFRQGLRANLNSAPALVGDGLVMPQLHEQPVQTQEIVNGVTYTVLTWRTSLSNIKEGKHTVRLELEATLLVPERRMSTSVFGRRSPFDDDMIDNFFGGYREKPIKAVSNDIAFNILPLPDKGRPTDFTGAIGDFGFTVSATPRQAETGEPITLSMFVSGTGNFDRIEAPPFPAGDDWKTYPPSTTVRPKGDSDAGEKVFGQAIVAKNPAIQTIPALSFSYFDPEKGAYITRESAPIPVNITGKAEPTPPPPPAAATTAAAPQPQPQEPVQPQKQAQPTSQPDATLGGLAPLHLETGSPVAAIKPLYTRPLFLTAIALCTLTLLLLVGLKAYRMQEAARPLDLRRKQLSRALRESCDTLDQAADGNDCALFLAACRTAIRQQLGAVWQCRPDAITRSDLAAKLPDATRLLAIFTVAEQAAYSGCRLDRETMRDYAATVKSELERLL